MVPTADIVDHQIKKYVYEGQRYSGFRKELMMMMMMMMKLIKAKKKRNILCTDLAWQWLNF